MVQRLLLRRSSLLTTIIVLALALLAPSWTAAQSASPGASPATPSMSANVSVYATGLNNPRGLKFGPDGALYVAEGGTGGSTPVPAGCTATQPPVGPYTGGATARISRIDANGKRTTVADHLISTQTGPQSGGLVGGISDVAFIGSTLYALTFAGGCSHGHPEQPNAILRVNADGTTTQVADISAFVKANPVAKPNPSPSDFEPDETPYSMIAAGNLLYFVESNHGALDKVDPATGTITRVIDISASEGHVVPTVVAAGPDGNFYVGNLDLFPVVAGDATIYKITPGGQLSVFAKGLTAVLGLTFDAKGALYALETSGAASGQLPFAPGTGRVVRVESNGALVPVATGLMLPTGMTFGPDGNLYVSNFGFGAPAGAGQIVKIDLSMPLPSPNSASPASSPSSI